MSNTRAATLVAAGERQGSAAAMLKNRTRHLRPTWLHHLRPCPHETVMMAHPHCHHPDPAK